MGSAAVPSIVQMLRDQDAGVRELAAQTLRQIAIETGLGFPRPAAEAPDSAASWPSLIGLWSWVLGLRA